MTEERTEELGEAGLLHLHVGQDIVPLRVLTIEESDAWQATFAESYAALEVPKSPLEGGELLRKMMEVGPAATLDLLLAYDLDGALGGRESLRKRMTKAQLRAAFDAILEAELPLDPDERRSVLEGFGLATQLMAATLEVLARSVRGSYQSGLSGTGGSPTRLSAVPGPESSSSSDGLMVKPAPPRRRRRA